MLKITLLLLLKAISVPALQGMKKRLRESG